MTNSVIKASYSDYRRVKSRKVTQIIFEVPSEQWPEIYPILSEPSIDDSRWFAIAELNEKAHAIEPAKVRKDFRTLPPAQQAALLCQAPVFQQFVIETVDSNADKSQEGAKQAIYNFVGVQSRADIVKTHETKQRWQSLLSEYEMWRVVA